MGLENPGGGIEKKKGLASKLEVIAGKLVTYGTWAVLVYGMNDLHKSYSDHQELQKIQSRYEQQVISEYEQLEEMYGRRFSDAFWISTWEGKEQNSKNQNKTATSTMDLENHSFAPEEIQEILETFPKGWVHNEVGSISQEKQAKRSDESYGLKGWVTVADCDQREEDGKSKITFYKNLAHHDQFYILSDVLGHELAHANDWESDNEMTTDERRELLLAITERLNSEDRFKSGYVESIKNDNLQKEKYLKAIEYWAVICSQYFYSPENMHIKDFQIVDRMVKNTDPEFNSNDQWVKRVKLIDKFSHDDKN